MLENFKIVSELISKITDSYDAAEMALDTINGEEDNRFQMGMLFINNATMNYLAAQEFYRYHPDLEHVDIEAYFGAFSLFKHEFLQSVRDREAWDTMEDNFEDLKANHDHITQSLSEAIHNELNKPKEVDIDMDRF